jgi:signal transduction histidine kinase
MPARPNRGGRICVGVLLLAGIFGGGLALSARGLPARGAAVGLLVGALVALACVTARARRGRAAAEAKCGKLQQDKHDFVAMVSHELRTPLTAVVGFSELLTDHDRPISPDRQREYLRIVREQSRHLARTIEDAVDLARLEDGRLVTRPVTLALQEAIEGALTLLDLPADRDRIDVAVAADTPSVYADQTELEQVLDRLLYVALTRSARHSRVRVHAGPGADGCAQLGVSAAGLDPDADLFAPLARTPEAGTLWKLGERYMGLSAARALLELFGGRIWTEQEGEETTIRFHLPAFAEAAAPAPTTTPSLAVRAQETA